MGSDDDPKLFFKNLSNLDLSTLIRSNYFVLHSTMFGRVTVGKCK